MTIRNANGWAGRLRFGSLRLRLVAVFAAVALTAALSVSGIAYWLNRDAVLTRAQNSSLDDFRASMSRNAGTLPATPPCDELRQAAARMAQGTQEYAVLLVSGSCQAVPDPAAFSLTLVPKTLRDAVGRARPLTDGNKDTYHLYWQRTTVGGRPYLVGGARLAGGGPTGYMFKSLAAERSDLSSLAWSLGIATLLALIGAALLAQAAASTVLRPVRRLGDAARRLGEGHLDTRLRVTGTDELAELSGTFNSAAEALQRRVEELSAREAASRRFVADMSHELRTPLTAITAVTEVLEDEADSLDPMMAPAVRLVVTETRRLGDLVENLMEVTRFDAGTARLRADEVDVSDMVTACMDARAWLDSVDLDAPRGILVRLDPRRLDVVMANLIGNALKHGGAPVRVTVRTAPVSDRVREAAGADGTGRELVIRVADNGPGIPEDVLPHVFDRFYKADASRARSEGSGLGLSIATENARIHHGFITAANRPGGGAEFTLRLPIPPDPDAAPDEADPDDPAGPAGPAGSAGSAGGTVPGGGATDGGRA
ncbi:HAMP domain-containing sensor histidine kinase [Streptomyces sp. SL13]|uniref:Sensor-like histidine kinase SenX3 n=1 Tax=Streptantibioticus silvisoli TaxID=2705255 RepID=A0AA90H134_9ACTN|nr:HAMP domain-containing sensor histidine kinase [Streptantibioticus silvisoli]MDI5970146.1 HAMP domain-containing sensor histidine kinase [Streptantibioticus silvisoli]